MILNKKLTSSNIPLHSYSGIAESADLVPYCEYPRSLAELRQLALTFDLDRYREENPDLPETEPYLEQLRSEIDSGFVPEMSRLRAGLVLMHHWYGQFVSLGAEEGKLIDEILDSLYRDVSGGSTRPVDGLGLHEPGIGYWPHGKGDTWHRRFVFEATRPVDRQDLFSRVAGQLLKDGLSGVLIRGLYLQPPGYGDDPDGPVGHIFTASGEQETTDERDRSGTEGTPESSIETMIREINSSGILGG